MKINQMLTLMGVTLAEASLTAHAQQPGRPPHRPPPPLIAALDANRDGVIDASEIANASTALKSLDKNADGQLTQEELRPPPPMPPPGGNGPMGSGTNQKTGRPPRHRPGGEDESGEQPQGGPPPRPPGPIMGALDVNHDGVIDAAELANASKAQAALDKNGDGQLTREELMPPPPQGGPDSAENPPPPSPGMDGPPPPPEE